MLGCSAMLETPTQEIYFKTLSSQTFSREDLGCAKIRVAPVETKGEETGFRFFLSQELKTNGNKIVYSPHRCWLCSGKERRSG